MAEISHESFEYIWNRMPVARGRHFQTAWYQAHGIECERLADTLSPLLRAI